MRVTCKHCGGAHPAFECRKKSTAARKDVPVFPPHQKRLSHGRVSGPSEEAGRESVAPTEAPRSRNQALPVDTNPKSPPDRLLSGQDTGTTPAGAVEDKDRQPTKFDRKAWMRDYQRNYMRNVYRPKLKASKSNPNTPERNDE